MILGKREDSCVRGATPSFVRSAVFQSYRIDPIANILLTSYCFFQTSPSVTRQELHIVKFASLYRWSLRIWGRQRCRYSRRIGRISRADFKSVLPFLVDVTNCSPDRSPVNKCFKNRVKKTFRIGSKSCHRVSFGQRSLGSLSWDRRMEAQLRFEL